MKPKILIHFSWRQIEDKPAPIYYHPLLKVWYSCIDKLFADLKQLLH